MSSVKVNPYRMRQQILRSLNIVKVQLLLFGLASSIMLPVFGQDHLEPAKDRSKYDGVLRVYYDGVFEKLLERMSEKPLARYLVITSFSPEYVLSLEEPSKDEYILRCGSFDQNFWYSKERSKVKVKYADVKVDKELALSIRQLFEIAISKIDVPKEKVLGNDGATYLFSIYDAEHRLKTGEIWSPKKDTKMRQLVDLCEKYKSLGTNKEESNRLTQLTRDMIQKLK